MRHTHTLTRVTPAPLWYVFPASKKCLLPVLNDTNWFTKLDKHTDGISTCELYPLINYSTTLLTELVTGLLAALTECKASGRQIKGVVCKGKLEVSKPVAYQTKTHVLSLTLCPCHYHKVTSGTAFCLSLKIHLIYMTWKNVTILKMCLQFQHK